VAVTKRLRYEVLRRDGFACRYCGAKAPDVELTVDHVTPSSIGGTDDPTNLVAACKPCNAGKSSSTPDAPVVADVEAEALRWARSVKAALGVIHARNVEVDDAVDTFDTAWTNWTYGCPKCRKRHPCNRPADWRQGIESMLNTGLTIDVLTHSVGIAMRKKSVEPNATWRYFCGVAWSTLRQAQDIASNMAQRPEP
jgi:hypothetical protein